MMTPRSLPSKILVKRRRLAKKESGSVTKDILCVGQLTNPENETSE
jgi:hypothetical protein